jgi:hypothetical protein
VVTHAASHDQDLIYPVNPPYRFSNRRSVGAGYGESARDSAKNTPRDLAFLYRPDDFEKAWNDLDRVLWPYSYTDAEVERAAGELTSFPTGELRFEILSVQFGAGENRPRGGGREEFVNTLKFRVTISWPRT